MSSQPPNGAARPKKSKLEKIAELESSLKIAKEENRRLKKEVHMLKSVGAPPMSSKGDGGSVSSSTTNFGEAEKMKDALKALKRVTINQEMSLQSLRAKASQRRQELEARDSTINKLHRHIATLKKNSSGDGNSRKLQDTLMDEEAKNVELTELLEATEAKVAALEKQLANAKRLGPFQRENSNGSMKSAGSVKSADASVSTAQEFDVAKMKKELAKKSNRIVELEYELEMTKDRLHELKQKQKRTNSDSFEADFDDDFNNPFGNSTFQKSQDDDFYSDHGGDDEDDWF